MDSTVLTSPIWEGPHDVALVIERGEQHLSLSLCIIARCFTIAYPCHLILGQHTAGDLIPRKS